MRINNNPAAFSTWTNRSIANDKLSGTLSRISTGVIKATDDPAGVAISERARAESKGTFMARFNTDNAISLIQTADSWMQKMNDMLSRMKSLAIEADGIMSQTDIENLRKEYTAMQDEIVAITSKDTAKASFNGSKLFTHPEVAPVVVEPSDPGPNPGTNPGTGPSPDPGTSPGTPPATAGPPAFSGTYPYPLIGDEFTVGAGDSTWIDYGNYEWSQATSITTLENGDLVAT